MESLAATCRRLADYHGMTDLPERLRDAVEIQSRQRVALAQAAECIERQRQRIAELEAASTPVSPSTIQ